MLKGFVARGLVALAPPALALPRPAAGAAAEIHRLSLCLSATPTSLANHDLNNFINTFNTISLESRGLEGIDQITSTWLAQAELRYFVRPNVAVCAGAGQLHAKSFREYLPRISQAITIRVDEISVRSRSGPPTSPAGLQPGRLPGPRLHRGDS